MSHWLLAHLFGPTRSALHSPQVLTLAGLAVASAAHAAHAVSTVPYSYFFIAAAIVECKKIILARKPADVGSIDYLVGALPTCKKTGGDKKLALGISANPRTSIWWRLMWAIGVLLYTGSLIATYFLLTQQGAPFVLAWAVAYSCCPSVIYRLAFTSGLHSRPESTISTVVPRAPFAKSRSFSMF